MLKHSSPTEISIYAPRDNSNTIPRKQNIYNCNYSNNAIRQKMAAIVRRRLSRGQVRDYHSKSRARGVNILILGVAMTVCAVGNWSIKKEMNK